jgi:hypothetical protein
VCCVAPRFLGGGPGVLQSHRGLLGSTSLAFPRYSPIESCWLKRFKHLPYVLGCRRPYDRRPARPCSLCWNGNRTNDLGDTLDGCLLSLAGVRRECLFPSGVDCLRGRGLHFVLDASSMIQAIYRSVPTMNSISRFWLTMGGRIPRQAPILKILLEFRSRAGSRWPLYFRGARFS